MRLAHDAAVQGSDGKNQKIANCWDPFSVLASADSAKVEKTRFSEPERRADCVNHELATTQTAKTLASINNHPK
jgi:hypothetical protein